MTRRYSSYCFELCDGSCGPIVYAARELGFRAVGIDRESEYCADAVKRLRQGVLPFS